MFDVRGLAIKVMNMSEEEQHKEIFNEIEKGDYTFESVGSRKKQFQGAYYIGNDVVVVKLEKEGVLYPVIMDRDIYDGYIAHNKANIRLEWDARKKPRIVVEGHERDENGKALRIWLPHLSAGRWAYSDNCVDHIRHNRLINLKKELRICSIGDNNKNSSRRGISEKSNTNADEYAYSLAEDCSQTLYVYVLMLLGDITADELAAVNKIVNSRRLGIDTEDFVA